jgi:hypothetical protein
LPRVSGRAEKIRKKIPIKTAGLAETETPDKFTRQFWLRPGGICRFGERSG